MGKFVYVMPDIAKAMMAPLKEKGFEAVLGDGTVNDELLEKCWAMVPSREPITKEVLDKAPNLKLIVKKGVGIDRIDLDECTRRGICVANTPFSNYISVGEQTVMLILGLAKQIYPISLALRQEEPDRNANKKYPPMEIYGKTLSVIGLGHIGMYVATLGMALGMKVVGYARHPEKINVPEGLVMADSMEEAIKAGDFVSLHISGAAENKNLFGEKEFAMMKSTAFFVNTTRGFVVDEKALINALNNKVIAGAGLDVVEKEPVEADNPLMAMKNVLLTPHLGGFTREAGFRGYMECVDIIADYADGIYPRSAVNNVEK